MNSDILKLLKKKREMLKTLFKKNTNKVNHCLTMEEKKEIALRSGDVPLIIYGNKRHPSGYLFQPHQFISSKKYKKIKL